MAAAHAQLLSLGRLVHHPPPPAPAPGWPSFAKCSGEGKRGWRDPPRTQGPLGGRELGALALGAGGVLGGLLSKHVEGLLCALPGARTRPCRDETPALVERVYRGGGRGYHKQEYNAWPCPWRPASPAPSSRRIRRRQGHTAGEWWSHGWSVLDLETQLELGWGLPRRSPMGPPSPPCPGPWLSGAREEPRRGGRPSAWALGPCRHPGPRVAAPLRQAVLWWGTPVSDSACLGCFPSCLTMSLSPQGSPPC